MKQAGMIKKTLIAVLVLLLISVGLLFTLDLGFLRNTVEQQVRDATGRSFEIDGDFSVKLGKELIIRSSNLVLGNAEWAGDKPLLEIRSMEAIIDPMSLLKGPVHIRQAKLDGIKAQLVQNDSGQANWEFSTSETAGEDASQLPFLLDSLLTENAEIVFQSPRLDQPIRAVIKKLEERVESDDKIYLDIEGLLSERAVVFNGTAGPYSGLLKGDNFAFEGRGSLGNIAVNGSASLDNLWSPRLPEFDLNVVGPEFSELTGMLGIEGLGDGDLSFTATGKSDGEQLITRLTGNFGELRMDVSSSMPSLQETARASINAQVDGPNFGRIARLLELEGWPEKPFKMHVQVQRPDNGLKIDAFNLKVAGAEVTLSGSVPDFPQAGGSEISLKISGADLAPFQKVSGLPSLPAGVFSLVGDVGAHEDGTTGVDMRYELPFASGTLRGTVGSGEGFSGSSLVFSGTGKNAAELGRILDVSGLAPEKWTSSAGIRINDAEYFELSDAKFETRGLSIALEGRVGSASLQKHSDVRFDISGQNLADFQAMVGEDTSLPKETFSLSGQASAIPGAWKLANVSGRAGNTGFTLNGTLGQGAKLAGSDLIIEAAGSDLDKMFSLPGNARLPDGPFTVRSRIGLTPGRLTLAETRANAGALNFELDANLPWPMGPGQGQFNLKTSGRNISRILPELGGLEFDAGDYEIKANGGWNDGKITIGEGIARIGKSELKAKGTLDLPPNLSATDLSLSISSPDLSQLGTVNGLRWEKLPFRLDTYFKGTNSRFTMENLKAKLGDNEILGTFTMDFEPKIPRFQLQFTANVLDLKPFQADPDAGAPRDKAASAKGKRLIPELTFPMETLSRFEGQFSFDAKQVLLKKMTLHNNSVSGQIKDGALTINEMGTDGYQGRLLANASLTPLASGGARLKTTVTSEGLIINLSKKSNQEKDALPAFDFDLDLTGNGQSLRDAAASFNGHINVYSTGGLVKNKKAESVTGLFLAEIIAAISPSEARREEINISCFAAVMKARDGIIGLDPGIAIQSDKLNAYATGNIHLDSEKIDVNFRTETRKTVSVSGSELISPYVKLSGTLANPTVALDPKGTLLSGGAAYLSGGLSILAQKALGTLTSSNDPCTEQLEKAGN